MWLSEKAAQSKKASGATAKVGGVTIAGEEAAVLLSGEYRRLRTLSPSGVGWRPGTGAQVLVIETDDGERFIAGAVDGGGGFPALSDGELCLQGGGASVKFCGDGTIRVTGDVALTGNVSITGSLLLNGKAVKVEES